MVIYLIAAMSSIDTTNDTQHQNLKACKKSNICDQIKEFDQSDLTKHISYQTKHNMNCTSVKSVGYVSAAVRHWFMPQVRDSLAYGLNNMPKLISYSTQLCIKGGFCLEFQVLAVWVILKFNLHVSLIRHIELLS